VKSLRTTLAFFLVIGIATTTFRSDLLIEYGITDLNWGWMASYLFPKALVLALTTLLIVALWFKLQPLGRYKFVGALVLFGLSIGGYLLVNTPYIEWIKKGTDMTSESASNPIEEYLNQSQPNFDGVICLALPGCPHCEVAIPKLALMQKRVPEIDVIVFVFTKDSSRVKSFQEDTGVDVLPFLAVPDPNNSIKLCEGKFPTFLYFKHGKVVHRWFNWQFGYPACDWVEWGLE